MSDEATAPVPAGWYPDPENPARGRYWDGTGWTDQFHTPGQLAPVLRAPEGTGPYTPWIWAIVIVPIVSYVPLFLIPWGSFFAFDPRNPESAVAAQLSIFTSPGYIGSIVLSLALYAAIVLFAYLDHRELMRRQVPNPFHWAWAFIPSYGALIYPIGRSVVVRSRLGGGALGPIWVLIGQFAIGMILTGVFMAYLLSAMSGLITSLR